MDSESAAEVVVLKPLTKAHIAKKMMQLSTTRLPGNTFENGLSIGSRSGRSETFAKGTYCSENDAVIHHTATGQNFSKLTLNPQPKWSF